MKKNKSDAEMYRSLCEGLLWTQKNAHMNHNHHETVRWKHVVLTSSGFLRGGAFKAHSKSGL